MSNWLASRMRRLFPVGTRSVLFGAHAVWLHPWFVAAAWWKLYGFPWDPRLWVAFFVHDIGYWGKPNMDGEEGELHPETGARVMHFLFDTRKWINCYVWYNFTLYHSRFYAKRHHQPVSRLGIADKFSICLTPWWVYGPMARLSGEIDEYMREVKNGKYSTMNICPDSARQMHAEMQTYLRRWVAEHKNATIAEVRE